MRFLDATRLVTVLHVLVLLGVAVHRVEARPVAKEGEQHLPYTTMNGHSCSLLFLMGVEGKPHEELLWL